jgi:hypothetical protein
MDNVGNISTNIPQEEIFDMTIDLRSHTFDPTNWYKEEVYTDPKIVECYKGEALDLTIQTTGNAEQVKVVFPSSWRSNSSYPFYVYDGGDGLYDVSKLRKLTTDYMIFDCDNDSLGLWERTITFVLPLYVSADSLYDVEVTAYKTNYDDIEREGKIHINEAGKTMLDYVYSSIDKTYRKRK